MTARVIADTNDTRIGLRLSGIEGVLARTEDEIKAAYNEYAADNDVALIIITEKIYNTCKSFFNEKRLLRTPMITVIPSTESTSPSSSISNALSEAMGINI